METIGRKGRWLAGLQITQIGIGLVGQVLLLARWSPHHQTDLFLLVSGIPWIMSAMMLVGGIEMALPSIYTQVDNRELFLGQVTQFTIVAGIVGAGISCVVIIIWAQQSTLNANLILWLGIGVGMQVLPAALASLWRGILIANDQLIQLRLSLLASSLFTVVGYALSSHPPARTLPVLALGSTVITMILSWQLVGRPYLHLTRWYPLHPQIPYLVRALLSLSIAVLIVHLQTLIERWAVVDLGTGYVTAMTVVMRGWEALIAIVVAAYVMPAFPHWANRQKNLLRWSLTHAVAASLIIASGAAVAAIALIATRWDEGVKAGKLIIVLIPRFVLLCSLQPLILKHYAQGTPWYPVMGSVIGLGIIVAGSVWLVPRYRLYGLALMTVGSVVPGWLLMTWLEQKQAVT